MRSGYEPGSNAPAPPENGKRDFEFQLQVTHPEFAGDTRWGELQRQQGITTGDLRSGQAALTLKSGLEISGNVVGPQGQPITKGWVVWSDEPYFGDGVWDRQATATLGWEFVPVGAKLGGILDFTESGHSSPNRLAQTLLNRSQAFT